MAAANPADAAPAPDDGKMNGLLDKIEKSQCYARNENSQFPMTNLFIGDSRLGCKSDADEQLILHIAFNEFVKVSRQKFILFQLGLHIVTDFFFFLLLIPSFLPFYLFRFIPSS